MTNFGLEAGPLCVGGWARERGIVGAAVHARFARADGREGMSMGEGIGVSVYSQNLCEAPGG